MRLDDILIRNGSATHGHVQEALQYQIRYGGRLEDHLFRFGYADEADLVKALACQFDSDGIVLSAMDIRQPVLELVSSTLACEKNIVPFDYESTSKTLKVACVNPKDTRLLNDLAERIPDKNIKLYVALGTILRGIVISCYRQALLRSTPIEESEGTGTTELIGTSDHLVMNHKVMNTPHGVPLIPPAKPLPTHTQTCHVLILNDGERAFPMLELALRHQGFGTVIAESANHLVELHEYYRSEIMLLVKSGNVQEVSRYIDDLTIHGLDLSSTFTFLVSDDLSGDDFGSILKLGVEDVVLSANILDLLIVKMNRVRDRLLAERSRRLEVIQDLGTHGSLEDMNVIDLLQMMGPAAKTVRISVTANRRQLTIFLDQGKLIFAECDEMTGAKAVFMAIPWQNGVWSIDPITPEDLPEPNNSLSNDLILLQGCQMMDEQNRCMKATPQTTSTNFPDYL